MMQPSLSVPSFAKINWSLEILGKRPDGYHELRTVLQTVSLHDDLHVEATKETAVQLTCDDPDVPINDSNLIVRAAHALQELCDVKQGARIRLDKKIPM